MSVWVYIEVQYPSLNKGCRIQKSLVSPSSSSYYYTDWLRLSINVLCCLWLFSIRGHHTTFLERVLCWIPFLMKLKLWLGNLWKKERRGREELLELILPGQSLLAKSLWFPIARSSFTCITCTWDISNLSSVFYGTRQWNPINHRIREQKNLNHPHFSSQHYPLLNLSCLLVEWVSSLPDQAAPQADKMGI